MVHHQLDWEEIQGQLVQETKGASVASNMSLVGRIISLKPINKQAARSTLHTSGALQTTWPLKR